MASPPVGRRPPGLGRGRGRGNAAANFGRPVPVGRGRGTKASAHTAPSPGTPPVSDRVPDPSSALAKGVHEEITGERLCVKVHVSLLGSKIDIDDVKNYFTNTCGYIYEGDIELSSAVLLGSGKAELVLDGLLVSELQELSSKAHKIKGTSVEVEFEQLPATDKGPPPLEGDSDGEEGPVTIVVGNVPRNLSMDALKAFFESDRSGGYDGAVANIRDTEPGIFHVTFHDRRVADQVMSRPLKVKRTVLEMNVLEEEKGEEREEEDREGEIEGGGPSETKETNSGNRLSQIEVSNVPEKVTERVLKTYFETGLSNSCPKAVSDCKKIREGVFTVTFHDPEVAAKVISKKDHKFKNTCLSVQYFRQPSRTEYKQNQLVVRGLPSEVEKDEYEFIIADCTHLDMEKFELVMNDDSTATIKLAKDYSIEELKIMMKKIAAKDIDGTTVIVEMVKASKPSLHVYNISTLCNEEFLKLYFGTAEKSGGGEIESVTVLSQTEAIITFVDPTVILSVLQKDHAALLGPKAVVKVHKSNSMRSSALDSGSTAGPLEISLDPLLVQSISLNPSALEQSLMKYQVKCTADEEKGMLTLVPTGRPDPKWRQECEESLVPQYLTRMTKESVHVPKEATTQARSLLLSLNKENPSLKFNLSSSSDGTEIDIAGETTSVSCAKVALKSLCSDSATHCTEDVFLSPEEFDFLEQVKQCDLPSDVEYTLDKSMFKIVLKGPKGKVMELKKSMPEIVSHSDTSTFVGPLATEFFKTEIGRGKLQKFLQERRCHVAVHFDESLHSVHFLFDPEVAGTIRAISKQLPAFVSNQTILIPEAIAPMVADMGEFKQLCETNEKKHEVLIKRVGYEVSVAGFKDQVSRSVADINVFFKGKSAPLPPLEVEVSSLVVRSVKRSPHGLHKCLNLFDVEMNCDTARGLIQLTPMHFLNPGWEEKCRSIVSEFIQHNVLERSINVPEKASTEITQILLDAQQSDNTFVSHKTSAATLSFAGAPDTVKSTEQNITQVCSNHAYKNEEIPLDPKCFELISQVKLKSMKRKFQYANLKLVAESNSIILSGPAKEVRGVVKEYLPSLTSRIVSVPVSVGKAVVQYLASEKGREKLLNLIQTKQGGKCAVYIPPPAATLSLLCTQKHKNVADRVGKAIVECTSVHTLKIPDLLQPFFPELPEFTRIVESFQGDISALIELEGSDIIVVAGFKAEVSRAVDTLSAMVKGKMAHFQSISIPVDPMIARCVQENLEDLQFWASSMQVTCRLNMQINKAAVIVSPTKDAQPNWKEECERLLPSYLGNEYFKETIYFPEEASQGAGEILVSSKYIVFETGADGNNATLAGEKSVVKGVKKQIDDMCSQTQITKEIKLGDREYDYFTQMVQNTFTSKIPFQLSEEKHTLTVAGSIYDVSTTAKSIKEAVQHAVVPVSVEEVVVRFIDTVGREELKSSMCDASVKAAVHVKMSVTPPTLELLCQEQLVQHVNIFTESLPRRIATKTLALSEGFTKPPFSQDLHRYSQELSMKHRVLIETKRKGIQICGFKPAAQDAEKSLEEFIKNKCAVSHTFDIQKGMWRLLAGPMKEKWNKIENACRSSEVLFKIPIEGAGEYVIEFKGDRNKVQKIMEDLKHLLQSTHTATVALESTQICQHFCEKGEGAMQLPGIEQKAGAIIEVCSVRGSEPAVKPKSHVSKSTEECIAQVIDTKHIKIYTGDITEFHADAIVNAANEDLRHIGGLAYAILKKGGKEIQEASDRYTRSHGKLSAGDVWLSKVVGKLPCQALIHAVGPRWQKNPNGRDELKEVCINCLTNAKMFKSIAFPAISSGTFGCPIDQCADVIISSAVEFCKSQRHTPLDEINIVLFKQSDVPHFVQALRDHLPPQDIKTKSLAFSQSSLPIPGNSPQPFPRAALKEGEEKEEPFEQTKAGYLPLSCVCIKEGGVLDVKAEIYVNSTNANMDLTGGAVAKAIAKAAGPTLQAECSKKAPVAAGEIAVTGPGKMQCKCIIHVNCPGYDKAGGQAEEMLRTIMNKCMGECESQGASTIVFPAIGTGNLHFPAATSAHVMVDEVCNYLQKNKCKSLSNVYIMIYNDNAMHRLFSEELEKRKRSESVPMKKKKSLFRGRRAKPIAIALPIESKSGVAVKPSGNHSLDFGNGVSMEILKGDITQENTDVIVNTTNENMVLDSGVSLALSKKAGKGLQEACNALTDKKGLRDGKVIETKSGNLHCKSVFHVMFRKDNFVEVISTCIEKARELKHKSISFPAIGTGQEKYPADAAAKDMIKGMKQCRTSSHVQVRIVLFQEDVYSKFVQVLESHQANPLQPAAATAAVVAAADIDSQCRVKLEPTYEAEVYAEDESLATIDFEIQIFGETKECVSAAEKSLRELISKEFKTEKIVNKKVGLLRESQVKTFKKEACDMQLIFRFDRKSNTIEFEGNVKSVYEMMFRVKDALSRVEKAETLMKKVQWKRQDSATGTSYDPLMNLEIEENSENPSHTFKDDVSGEHFTIDFKKMEETDHALGGKTCRVVRATIELDDLPKDWEPMIDPVSKKEVPLRVIHLVPSSDGYKFALGEFDKTMRSKYKTIVRIQRIQNPVLFKQFIAKKKHLDSNNPPGVQNERWLFHGTKESSITFINKTNFNRSYRGQNGTMYGQGCYFAHDASYSNGFAPPDAQGQKHMYVVRVLTGEFTTGRNEMIVAPPKNPSDKAVLFDSVVNNTSAPSIFVVFYDADAYPEYLITYK